MSVANKDKPILSLSKLKSIFLGYMSDLLALALMGSLILTIAGYFGRYWWGLDLAGHFRVQYLLIGGVAALIYAVRKRWRLCVIGLLLAIINGGQIVPVYVGESTDKNHGHPVRMMMSNVNTANRNYDRLLQVVRRENPDVVLLLEIDRNWVNAIGELRRQYPCFIERPSQGNFGIGLYSRLPVKHMHEIHLGSIKLSSLDVSIEVEGVELSILGAHLLPPAGGTYWKYRNEQLMQITKHANSLHGPFVMLGDLNTTPWSVFFSDLLKESGLRDSRKGFGIQPSWPTLFPPLRIPIDHCLVSKEVIVKDRHIGPSVGSDHYPLIVDVAVRR